MPLFKPTYLVDGDLTDLSLDKLLADGIKGIILDLDSTLVAPRSGMLTKEAEQWLFQAKSRFKVAVVSNNKNDLYMLQIQKLLNVPVLGRAAKPGTKVFKVVLADFGLSPDLVVVVGDRPLTDVWGGQRIGAKTALVLPLKSMNEPAWILFFRRLERCFIRN
jgi:HAD superfamily phosphatase (TIGR01668 family)